MNPGRMLSEHRPLAILIMLTACSIFSLITGTESSFLHQGLSRAVSLAAYPFLKVRQATTSGASRVYAFVADHNRVYVENERLVRETAALRERTAALAQLELENQRLRDLLGYVRTQPRLSLKPAAVLESYKGMLRIEGGTASGIEVSMGVITHEGVVGIVTEAADFTSTVATLHHMDCRVGAMVLRNRLRAYDGVVHASGSDFSYICGMEYIDMKEEVRVGDWVVTSPESLFPAGLPIGRITAVRSGGGLWKSAEVKPAVDPYRLDEVLVILRAVDDSEYVAGTLESQAATVSSDAVSNAPAMPDMRSLQERYAP